MDIWLDFLHSFLFCRSKPLPHAKQTTATLSNLLYYRIFRIYFCGCADIGVNHIKCRNMYINDDVFEKWAKKLDGTMREMGKDLKSLLNTNEVFDKDDRPLDNQDVSLLLNVSHRTLQRYRTEGLLPFFKLGQKIYYKQSDVREFVYKNSDYWDKKSFDNATQTKENL